MNAIDLYIRKLPPEPVRTPTREACHQPGVNDMIKDTLSLPEGAGPNPNLAIVLKTLLMLALIAACVFGDISEVIIALLLRRLP